MRLQQWNSNLFEQLSEVKIVLKIKRKDAGLGR